MLPTLLTVLFTCLHVNVQLLFHYIEQHAATEVTKIQCRWFLDKTCFFHASGLGIYHCLFVWHAPGPSIVFLCVFIWTEIEGWMKEGKKSLLKKKQKTKSVKKV